MPSTGPELGGRPRAQAGGAALPEARSEGSTRPSRTWRGWRSRSPAGPGRSCGSSTLPRCHGCGGSRGLPACLEVPQEEGKGTSAPAPQGAPQGSSSQPAAPALGTGCRSPCRDSRPWTGGKEESERGARRGPRKERMDSGVSALQDQPPGLSVPPSSYVKWARPPGPPPGAVWKMHGARPHILGSQGPAPKAGWAPGATPEPARSLGACGPRAAAETGRNGRKKEKTGGEE